MRPEAAAMNDQNSSIEGDSALLPDVVSVAVSAGRRLLAVFSPDARPTDLADLSRRLQRNEQASLEGLREALGVLRPGAGWVEEDQESAGLPAGEWWAVDAVEGNVNHAHGMNDWCVSIALVRDGEPVLAVVHQPIGNLTHTALRGGGAHLNGGRLQTSSKTDLKAAIATTGQAEAGQAETYGRIGTSITVMLGEVLLVRSTVPSTFPLLLVAAGHHDVFWQYEPTLPGIAAGILLVSEAGGVVSRVDGSPWQPGSPDVLVTTRALHEAVIDVLAPIH
jgi:myo-inositol-1(or 4)-monophosphatase